MQFPGNKRKPRHPCSKCHEGVYANEEALLCEDCGMWQHLRCIEESFLTREEYSRVVARGGKLDWKCKPCTATSYAGYMASSVGTTGGARSSTRTRKINVPARFRNTDMVLTSMTGQRRQRQAKGNDDQRSDSSLLRSMQGESEPEDSTDNAAGGDVSAAKQPQAEKEDCSTNYIAGGGDRPAKRHRAVTNNIDDAEPQDSANSIADDDERPAKRHRAEDNKFDDTSRVDISFEPELESTRNDAVTPPPIVSGLPPLSPPSESTRNDAVTPPPIVPGLQPLSPPRESTRNDPVTPPAIEPGLAALSPPREQVPSIDVDEVPYEIPPGIEESSIADPAVEEELDSDFELTFKIIPKASTRGKDKLADSRGYGYVVRQKKGDKTYWRCDVRNKQMKCGSSVIQTGDNFSTSWPSHCHAPQVGKAAALKVIAKVKEDAGNNVFLSAQTIVTDSIRTNTNRGDAVPALPSDQALRRTANRIRERKRPADPKDLKFELSTDFIPQDFLIKDICMNNGRRHVLFGTPHQLEVLAQAKRWYLDGTFQIIRKPFYQLFTIHSFVRKDETAKQVPLCYVLMLGKETADYKAVMEAVKEALPITAKVKEMMLDFEMAVWNALEEVFPEAKCTGCVFHWKNAVWRKIQEVGLQRTYLEKGDAHQLLRELMALPFLPHERIPEMFQKLMERAQTEMLKEVFLYVQRTWLEGSWEPQSWSTFMMAIRTNNDVEGWHHRLNRRVSGCSLGMYRLIIELHRESMDVDLQLELLSGRKLKKYQKKLSKQMQGKIFKFWQQFNDGERKTESLLRACSALYGNAPVIH